MVLAHVGGKLLLVSAGVPSLGAGKVRPRDAAAGWGTDAEHKARVPDDPFFKKFAAEASRAQIAIDVFSFRQERMRVEKGGKGGRVGGPPPALNRAADRRP